MQTHRLLPHPARPPLAVRSVSASLRLHDHWLVLRWRIEGAARLIVPAFAGKGRADDLWRTTCFELFVRSQADHGGYAEFNFAPSERWAAYDFTGYREGMTERAMPLPPVCTLRAGGTVAIFEVAVSKSALPALPLACGISTVLEEEGAVTSYWALRHPPGQPDFHDPDCFALSLAAPG